MPMIDAKTLGAIRSRHKESCQSFDAGSQLGTDGISQLLHDAGLLLKAVPFLLALNFATNGDMKDKQLFITMIKADPYEQYVSARAQPGPDIRRPQNLSIVGSQRTKQQFKNNFSSDSDNERGIRLTRIVAVGTDSGDERGPEKRNIFKRCRKVEEVDTDSGDERGAKRARQDYDSDASMSF